MGEENMNRFKVAALRLATAGFVQVIAFPTAFGQPEPSPVSPKISVIQPEGNISSLESAKQVAGLPFSTEVIPYFYEPKTNFSVSVAVKSPQDAESHVVGTLTRSGKKLWYNPSQQNNYYMVSSEPGTLDTVFPALQAYVTNSVPKEVNPELRVMRHKGIPSKIMTTDGTLITFQQTQTNKSPSDFQWSSTYQNLDSASQLQPTAFGAQSTEAIRKKLEDHDRRPEDR